MKEVIDRLDGLGLPHGMTDGEWVAFPGDAQVKQGPEGGMELLINGKNAANATIYCRQGAQVAGGRVTAHFHAPGAVLVLDAHDSTRHPAVLLHVYAADALIYLNLDDLEPVLNRPLHLQVTFYNGKNQLFYWGEGASSVETRCVVDGGDDRLIIVGRDAMLSNDVYLRTHDGHALVDIAEHAVINPGGDVVIGSHVWIGQEVLVVGPAQVGNGAVIGTKSFVKKEIPEKCIAGGVPAKVLRENTTWSRVPNTTAYLDEELKGI